MKKHVLLVDDNDKVRALLKSLIELAGYKVIEARDGLDGLTKAKTMAFDLFVVDYRMPVMDGITLIKGLKEIPMYQVTPMILVTTDDSHEFSAKVAQIDDLEVLHKPVGQNQLLNLLAQLTEVESAEEAA
ncbi:MAG: two-component system chemotaxis response regulator CheY [Phenylobacterium sp.]|jgi:two-component system chemotaxis response regulator CheY